MSPSPLRVKECPIRFGPGPKTHAKPGSSWPTLTLTSLARSAHLPASMVFRNRGPTWAYHSQKSWSRVLKVRSLVADFFRLKRPNTEQWYCSARANQVHLNFSGVHLNVDFALGDARKCRSPPFAGVCDADLNGRCGWSATQRFTGDGGLNGEEYS